MEISFELGLERSFNFARFPALQDNEKDEIIRTLGELCMGGYCVKRNPPGGHLVIGCELEDDMAILKTVHKR